MTMKIMGAAAAAFAVLAAPASAATVKVNFEGTNSSSVGAGNNSLGENLTSISGTLIYETDASAQVFVSNSAREALNYDGAITGFSFETGGVSGSAEGLSFGRIQVSDQFTAGSDRISFGSFAFGPSRIEGEKPGIQSVSFTLAGQGGFDLLDSAALPKTFTLDDFDRANLSLFVRLIDPASQPGVAKSLNFNLTRFDAQVVPVPAAGLLLLPGLTLMALARRRRRG